MNRPCPFNATSKMFQGSPAEQAACLLRRVRVVGNVDDAPASLPEALLARVGKAVDFSRTDLEAYLSSKGVATADIGGALDKPLSKTSDGKTALYFMIHDTSDEISGNSFPADINEPSWPGNKLASRNVNSAHIFLNRTGQSRTGHEYSVGFRATKFEQPASRAAKGLFLHHELIQPRIKGGFAFHAVGPEPGYPSVQLERLAHCYLAASLRRGSWLIPAFHCVLDLGIADGHDDPQNFDLFQWAGLVERIHGEVKAPQPPVGPMGMVESMAATVTAASAPVLEDARSVSDGKRTVKVRRVKATKPLFFKAKMAIDADGAARAYHPKDDPEALDVLAHANRFSKKFIQGKSKNGEVGLGPRPGFFVSATSLQKGEDHDADSYVDAEFIPYIVLPDEFAPGVEVGCVCTIVNLKNDRVTPAIFADTNPNVGEASVRAAINLRVQEPSFPITELAKGGGDDDPNYVYIVFPDSKLKPASSAPHWPADVIAAKADALFAEWGGLAMVRKIFG